MLLVTTNQKDPYVREASADVEAKSHCESNIDHAAYQPVSLYASFEATAKQYSRLP